jgi:hypothetical protein
MRTTACSFRGETEREARCWVHVIPLLLCVAFSDAQPRSMQLPALDTYFANLVLSISC